MLNPNPRAVDFIDGMSTKARRNAMLGNVDSFKSDRVRNLLNQVHNQVSLSIDVVKKLAKDESRTEVSKHARAKVEAETLNHVLAKARDEIRAEADRLEGEATSKIDATFKLDPSKAVYHGLKLAWLKEQWNDPNGGSAAITKQVKLDPELSSLLFNGDAYIIGVSDEARLKFIETGVKAHVPDAYQGIETAKQMRDTSDKYDGVMNNVRTAFYIESVAAKIESRVE
jgi:hypothetical protein